MLKRLLTRVVVIAILSMVALIVVLNLRHLMVCAIAKTDMLRAAEARQTASAEILLIKGEQLVTAPANGQATIVRDRGERVRAGEKIAEIVPYEGSSPINIYSPVSGIVDSSDGMENILARELADVIDVSTVPSNGSETGTVGDFKVGFEVSKGHPLCKIVDNLEPIYAVALAKDGEKIFSREEKDVTILWNGNNIQASVEEISGKLSDRAILDIDCYPGILIMERWIEADLVTGNASGLAVYASSLVSRENKPGLFVIKGLKASWEPVNILDKSGDMIIIEGESLKENDLYVVNPFLVRDGDRV
ncbi:MAG TPA: HlyD family efflux transporter periplasmic adaptor subunit [Clostridia bacterium]|nr:HlyD family efflux transporter periplasmic adaptor subunit [Clostridia bacterium]